MFKSIVSLCVLFVVAACGGGTSNAPVNPFVTVTAPADDEPEQPEPVVQVAEQSTQAVEQTVQVAEQTPQAQTQPPIIPYCLGVGVGYGWENNQSCEFINEPAIAIVAESLIEPEPESETVPDPDPVEAEKADILSGLTFNCYVAGSRGSQILTFDGAGNYASVIYAQFGITSSEGFYSVDADRLHLDYGVTYIIHDDMTLTQIDYPASVCTL